MCEIFGSCTSTPVLLNELLKEFFSHGDTHPHGWGLAFPMADMPVSCEKEPENANKSNYLKHRLRAEIRTKGALAHIRLATKGGLCYENTHPFMLKDRTGRSWTLVHNGTVFECPALDKYFFEQQGQTDSERILCHLISRINERQNAAGQPLNAEERFQVLETTIEEIVPGNKLNLLIHDGKVLYAHTNYKNSLYISRKENEVYFSTRPLHFGHWDPLPMNTLISCENGRLLKSGTAHQHEFFDDAEKMRLLFLDYSGL